MDGGGHLDTTLRFGRPLFWFTLLHLWLGPCLVLVALCGGVLFCQRWFAEAFWWWSRWQPEHWMVLRVAVLHVVWSGSTLVGFSVGPSHVCFSKFAWVE